MRCAELTGAAAGLARPVEPRLPTGARGGSGPLPYRPALPVCQQIAEGGAQLLQSPVAAPWPARPFGLDCGRHCLDAFTPAAGRGR